MKKLNYLISDKFAHENYVLDKIRNYSIKSDGNLKNYNDLACEIEFFIDSKPVLYKKDIRERQDDFNGNKKLISRKTSGTTGIPLKINYSRSAVADQFAIRKYAYSSLGIRLGDREARFWGGADSGFKNRCKNFLLNRKLFTFSRENIDKEINLFVKYKPSYIYGYSSLIINAANELRKRSISPPPIKAIICTAETIEDFQINQLSEFFNAPVAVEYGCTEVDIIAYKFFNEGYKIINPNLILEESDQGLILTDIGNSDAGLIRYCLGDDVVFDKDGPYFLMNDSCKSIQGRSQKRIVKFRNGNICHAVVFSKAMDFINTNFIKVSKFLVIQRNLEEIDVFIEAAFDDAEISNKLLADVKESLLLYLPDSIELNVEFSVVPNNKNNKFDYFISEI